MIVPLTTNNYKHKMGDTNSSTSDPPATKETPTKESYWWHVNKGGFPIPQHTWEKLWSHVIDVHPQGDSLVREIRGRPQKRPPTPTAPTLTQKSPVPESLQAVQSYMNELQYNHTGTQFFDIRKRGPLSRLMDCAREILRESLPIKCLEAVVLSLYLTSPLSSVQRFAIGFKSKFGGLYYRHIVLGIHWNSLYGALGMSRRDSLMYKPLSYTSLGDLIIDFIESYREGEDEPPYHTRRH
ncbi:tubulinyl-Tyr carboxypeptidase 2-like isoform X2 [Halichondria panicea]|uniref:tubulinyl-Tyr carboxypeptidase 2-like isoform X2 n=1 Tax=Halichondria panicea TaxID=6063 RepID=UPI00312B2C72